MAAFDSKQKKVSEKKFTVTEVDFKGLYKRNFRTDRVTPKEDETLDAGKLPVSSTLNYEFTQDIVFGFCFLLKLPIPAKPKRTVETISSPIATTKPTSTVIPSSCHQPPVKGLDLEDEDDNEEDEEDEDDAVNEEVTGKSDEIGGSGPQDSTCVDVEGTRLLSKQAKRLLTGRLSRESQLLVQNFLGNIKSIRLRYLNIVDRPHFAGARHYPYIQHHGNDDSDPFFVEIAPLLFEMLKHHRYFKQTPTHIVIRISELFFSPNSPLLPKITSAGLYLTVDFHRPVHWVLLVSCLDTDPNRIYHRVHETKYGEQQLLIPELAKPKHNISVNWHVSFTQPLKMYKSENHQLSTMNEITIHKPFSDTTEYVLLSLEDARNDLRVFVLHELQSVTVKHHNVIKRYMPNSYRKTENCYLNGYQLSFQKRMLMKSTLDALLHVKWLTALTMDYVDFFDPKDLMQFLIVPHGKGPSTSMNSITFRFYKVIQDLNVRLVQVNLATVQYRPKIDRTFWIDSKDRLENRVPREEFPFTVLHKVEKDANQNSKDGEIKMTKTYHVYRPQARCHLLNPLSK